MMQKEWIARLSGEYRDRVREHRHHLHRHPELSFHEKETQAYICSVLEGCGVPYETIDGFCCVIGTLQGGLPGKTVAFRADIDALEMQEENEGDLVSQNPGVMHACGHDGHTAILLAFAEMLSAHRAEVPGKVVFLFQHAEERLPGGAKTICEAGFLDGVDYVYGGHIWPTLPIGEIACTEGALMSAPDAFELQLSGQGGHGSEPHRNRDVLLAACTTVQQLQNIVSRRISAMESAVLSVCQLHAGTAFNVMPSSAMISGTVRTFNPQVQKQIIAEIEQIAKSCADLYGVEAKLDYRFGYPAVINHPETTAIARRAIGAWTAHTAVTVAPSPVAEDFSYYQQRVPGTFFYFGSGNEAKGVRTVLHSATYQMDEDVLQVALETYLACLLAVNEPRD